MIRRMLSTGFAAALLVSTASFGQVAPPVPDGAPPQAGRVRGGAQRMQQAHDRLGITPVQQPQWDAVVATLRDNARAMRASPAREAIRAGQMSGPQALRAAADLSRQRSDAMQRMVGPVDALYATLSPEQRQIADKEIARMTHPGGGRHG